MALDLARLPAEDDPPEDWTDSPDPEEIAQIVERSFGLADGTVGAAVANRRTLERADGTPYRLFAFFDHR